MDSGHRNKFKAFIAAVFALSALSFFVLRVHHFATATNSGDIENVSDLTKQNIEWDVFYGESTKCGDIECHLTDTYRSDEFDKKMVLPAREFPLKGYKKGQIIYLRTKYQLPKEILESKETIAFYTIYIWAKRFEFYVGQTQIESGGQESIFTTIPRNLINSDGSVDIAIRVDPGELPYQGLAHRANIMIGLKKHLSSFQFLAHDYKTEFYMIYIIPMLMITIVFTVLYLTIYKFKDIFYFISFGFLSTVSLILGSDYKSDYFDVTYDAGMVGEHGVKIITNLIFLKFIQTFFRRESKAFDRTLTALCIVSSVYIGMYLYVPQILAFMGGGDHDVTLTSFMKLLFLSYGTFVAINTSLELRVTHRNSFRYVTTSVIGAVFACFVLILSIELFTNLIPNNAVWIDKTFNFSFFVIMAALVAVELVGNLKTAQQDLKATAVHVAVAKTTQILAHDVRKPFSILKVGLQALSGIEAPQPIKEKVNELVVEANHSINLVDGMVADILEVSSKTKIISTPTKLFEILEKVIKNISQLNQKAEIELEYRFEHTKMLAVAPLKIERALTNIVDNAVQAMNGKGKIWFKTTNTPPNSLNFLTLEIGNSNSYIAPKDRKRLFESFYTDGKENGTGLGLAICKKVINAHGGEITCCSDRSLGTWFTLTIPLSEENDTSKAHQLPPSIWISNLSQSSKPMRSNNTSSMAISAPTRTNKSRELKCTKNSSVTIAIVEDNAFIRDAWVKTLSDVNTLNFEDPKSFWAYYEKNIAELDSLTAVITDYHFDTQPNMNGEEFAHVLRPKLPNTPIILSTDSISSPNKGAFELCIEKLPLSWHALERLIEALDTAS